MSQLDRPTFDESWYRVASLRPRLHPAVRTYRQNYRGRLWHVIHDPANNQCFRISEPAYFLVGLLDGKRTVADAWRIAGDRYGDDAPTQGEALQLLGQLYTSNLLHSDIPVDAAGMFERYRKRIRREVGGYAMNILFPRVPLFDPDQMLNRWVDVVGWIFSPVGRLLWLVLIIAGFYQLMGRWGALWRAADPQSMLATGNLVLLYVCFAGIKAIHELGHAFATKYYGRRNQSSGEVHVIGIMLLVLMPVPYVDASIAWTFRSKWHRVIVGAAGMYVELAIASVAAMVWAHTGEGMLTHDIAYNLMFIASVSTVLFNGNPLLRYDGYYMLSDLLEMPNLAQNSKLYLYYLVNRYVFGVKQARRPSDLVGERIWFVCFGIASGFYRVLVSVAILFYIADKLFFIGVLLAMAGLVTYAMIPLGKFAKFLATSPELDRVRSRAVVTTICFTVLLLIGIGVVPRPDYERAEGVVAPRKRLTVYAREAGFVQRVLADGSPVVRNRSVMLLVNDPSLRNQLTLLHAERREAEASLRLARMQGPAEARIAHEKLTVIERQITRTQQRIDRLAVRSDVSGLWIAPDIDSLKHSFVKQGQKIGVVAPMDHLIVRVVADQTLGPRLTDDLVSNTSLEMRLRDQPGESFTGKVVRIFPAGDKTLPSPALAVMAGGAVRMAKPTQQAKSDQDEQALKAAEPVFEVDIQPRPGQVRLLPGERVEVRFQLASQPLAWQWWRSLRQLIQQRFQF